MTDDIKFNSVYKQIELQHVDHVIPIRYEYSGDIVYIYHEKIRMYDFRRLSFGWFEMHDFVKKYTYSEELTNLFTIKNIIE